MSHNIRKFILCLITISVMAATSTVFHLTQAFSKDFARGRRAFEQKDYQTAAIYLNSAAQHKPSDKDTLKYLITVDDKLGRDQELIEHLKQLEQVENKDARNTIWIADLYYKLDDFENAERFYRKALKNQKTTVLQNKLAEVLLWQEKYNQAVELFRILPENMHNLRLSAICYDGLEQDEETLRQLEKLDRLNHDAPEITLWAADLCYKLKDFKKAETFYRKVLSYNPLPSVEEKLAEVLIYQKKYNDAINILEALPENIKTIELRAIAYDGLGQDEDILAQLQKLEQFDHDTVELTIWIASLYYKFNDFEKAEMFYRKALAEQKSPDLEKRLAEIFTWQKKYTLAIDLLEKLPENPETTEFLADIYTWNKNYDDAVTLYKKLLSNRETNNDIMLKLADALRAAKRDNEAITYYRQYLEQNEEL